MIIATVIGRIGKDAENRAVGKDGVTSFSVASSSGRKGSETTTWTECSIWSTRGKALQPYLKKGGQVTVVGELTTREHNGKTYLQLKVDHIELQGGKQQSGGGGSPKNDLPQDDVGSDNTDTDEIPF